MRRRRWRGRRGWGWRGRRICLRFGSAVYHARGWLNGEYLGEHLGGHLPFAFDAGSVGIVGDDGEQGRAVSRTSGDFHLHAGGGAFEL